jgi:starch phosphorylase
MSVARYLVQGCDVWLNTPRRPNEASGTSGMKLLANGGLNLSILDGWWDEAFDTDVGWAIGRGEEYPDTDYQDRVEGEALYDLLEQDVVPLFYDRDSAGIPRGWVNRMKASMKWLSPVFNTNRMVAEYAERFYVPVAERYAKLSADGARRAHALVDWRKRVIENWKEVHIHEVTRNGADNLRVGDRLTVSAVVNLGPLQPGDVTVQIFTGTLDPDRQIEEGATQEMTLANPLPGGYRYVGEVECHRSGLCGLTVRVVPRHDDALVPYEISQVAWATDKEGL